MSILHSVIIACMIGGINYTSQYDDELYVVAATIAAEALGEPMEGIDAVASVIYNRSMERKMTPYQVCLQPKQFSCWNGKSQIKISINTIDDMRKMERCIYLAYCMQIGNFAPTTRANHYYNPKLCSPSWGKKMKDKKQIKNHLFGRI